MITPAVTARLPSSETDHHAAALGLLFGGEGAHVRGMLDVFGFLLQQIWLPSSISSPRIRASISFNRSFSATVSSDFGSTCS
jgi:hypothetical protein